MLPSLSSLVREHTLLWEVIRAAEQVAKLDDAADCQLEGATALHRSSGCPVPPAKPSKEVVKQMAVKVADTLETRDSLQELPSELLVDIAEQFLESPVWHLCQLGETSEHLGKVFNDEALWQGFFETRFSEAAASPSRKNSSASQRASSPTSARQMYADLHLLETRFREGSCSEGALANPRKGVAVLDLRIAPGPLSTSAFAALRDGSIMVYDLDPERNFTAELEAYEPQPAKPAQELSGPEGSGPALCCLPVELPEMPAGTTDEGAPLMLVAGYALGRLSAWHVPSGSPLVVESWEQAHACRVSAVATLGAVGSGGALLSAGGDGLVKAWDLGVDRFGDHRQSFGGHAAAVVSVAAAPLGRHTFLTGSHDRTMRLWDARQGDGASAEVARWRQQDWVTCVEFHPTSSDTIFSSDKSLHQWDLRKVCDSPLATLHRHRKLISRFRVDPLRLASCSLDGCVKVSSLEDAGVRRASPHASPSSSPILGPAAAPVATHLAEAQDVCTLRSSADYVLCIDFDSTRLLAGAVDGRVAVYDFSYAGHFGRSSPPMSPLAAPCRQSVDNFEIVGMPEIEV